MRVISIMITEWVFLPSITIREEKSFERNNDVASWSAQYMGTPIERDGVLFLPDGMNYFNGVLPDEDPVAVYSSVDVAWGGGDYLSMPIIKEYENGDKFVVGWRI